MKISKKELVKMKACKDGLKRFIKQTNGVDDSVDVISLIGGENTTGDLLWLAGEKLHKDKIVKFTCSCALINIELIKPYVDDYDLIVKFLNCPLDASSANRDAVYNTFTADVADAAHVAYAAAAYAAAAADAGYDAADAAHVATRAADAATRAADAATRAADAINALLVELFTR